MCKRIILSGVSLCLIVYLFISAYRTPMPIIKHYDDCNLVYFRYNAGFEQGDYIPTEITEYDKQAVLKCLSKYNEQRTFEQNRYGTFGKSLCDSEIIILIHTDVHTDNSIKKICIGKEDYIDNTDDEMMHQIVNASDLENELKAFIK